MDAITPAWLVHHYENETGYSFPSGHTIFAATWLMLAVGFTQLLGNRSLKQNCWWWVLQCGAY